MVGRGAFVIKSNTIHPGQVTNTNWKIIISQSFYHRTQRSKPNIRLSSLGVCQREKEFLGHPVLWLVGLQCRDQGKQKLHSWRVHTRFHGHWDPKQSSDSTETWGGRGWLWLTVGTRTLVVEGSGNTHQYQLSWDKHLSRDWPHSTACRLRCWDILLQTTKRRGTQAHPSADRLLKVFLIPWPPINTPHDTALCTRGIGSSSNTALPTSEQVPISPTRKPTSPKTNLTHQETDNRSKRNYNPAACRMETTNRES